MLEQHIEQALPSLPGRELKGSIACSSSCEQCAWENPMGSHGVPIVPTLPGLVVCWWKHRALASANACLNSTTLASAVMAQDSGCAGLTHSCNQGCRCTVQLKTPRVCAVHRGHQPVLLLLASDVSLPLPSPIPLPTHFSMPLGREFLALLRPCPRKRICVICLPRGPSDCLSPHPPGGRLSHDDHGLDAARPHARVCALQPAIVTS